MINKPGFPTRHQRKNAKTFKVIATHLFLLNVFFLIAASFCDAWGEPNLFVEVNQTVQNPAPVNFNTSAYQGLGPVVTINNIFITNLSLDPNPTGISSATEVKFYLIYPYPQPYTTYLQAGVWESSYAPYSNPLDPSNPNWTIVPNDSRTVLLASVSVPPLGNQISCLNPSCTYSFNISTYFPTTWGDGSPIALNSDSNNPYYIAVVVNPTNGGTAYPETVINNNVQYIPVLVINQPVNANGNTCPVNGCAGTVSNSFIVNTLSDSNIQFYYIGGNSANKNSNGSYHDHYNLWTSDNANFTSDSQWPNRWIPLSVYDSVQNDLRATATGFLGGKTFYFKYEQVIDYCNGCKTGSQGLSSVVAWGTTANNITNLLPQNLLKNTPTAVNIQWTGGNIPTQTVSYDLYWGAGSPSNKLANVPAVFNSSTNSYSYTLSGLSNNTTYSWKLVAHSGSSTATGPTWSFTTSGPPMSPNAPSPAVGAGLVSTTPTLTWNGGDPNSNLIIYDIYLGKQKIGTDPTTGLSDCPLRDIDNICAPVATVGPNTAINQTFIPGTLNDTSTYYWKVIARNGSYQTVGPTWWFFTIGQSFQISTLTSGAFYPKVAYSSVNSNFLIAWQANNNYNSVHASLVRASDGYVINADILINTSTTSSRNAPVIASDGSNYLVVWWDTRNSSADIYGALVRGSDGAILRNDIPISTAANSQIYPSVSYDPVNGNYMAVWMDYRNGNYDIYGSRIRGSDGTVLDTNGILISNAVGTQQYPAVAYGNGMFVVTWEDYRSANDIYGARIRTSDAFIYDANGIKISPLNDGLGAKKFPALAYDGTNFFVVWQEGRKAGYGYDIVGTLFRPSDGTVLQNPSVTITLSLNDQSSPSIAYANGNYFVVWHDLRDELNPATCSFVCDYNIYGAWVNTSGVVLDNLNIPITKAVYGQLYPSVAFGSSNYFAVWQDSRNQGSGGNPEVFGQGRGNANFFKPGLGDDITPPSVPSNLIAVPISSQEIDLSWDPSIDNTGGTGVAGYNVYRNGFLIATTSNTSYPDFSLTPNTSYTYNIASYDGDRNLSARSANVIATTLSDIDLFAPVFTGTVSVLSGGTFTIFDTIKNQGTGNAGPFNVKYYLAGDLPVTGGVLLGTHSFAGGMIAGNSITESFSLTISTGTVQGNYYLGISVDSDNQVIEYNKNNNIQSLIINVDNTAPTVNLTFPSNGAYVCCTVNVAATANDNVAVKRAIFYLDGVATFVVTNISNGLTWAWNTTTATNGSHTLMVKAYDAAGNVGVSPVVTVQVDETPPSIPGNLIGSAPNSSQVNLSWTASTDSIGVVGYLVERCSGSGCTAFAQIDGPTSTSYSDSGLSASTSYSYRVRAINAAGNLSGYSNIVTVTTPTSSSNSSGVPPALVAGRYHSCALLSNSTVQCWGLNADGELGNGTTINSSTPVVVSGINSATMIAAGGWHNCALLSNSTVQCWGNNSYSQLGNGGTSNSSTPVTVPGITTATAIVGGVYDTCVLLSNGTIQCWGLNSDGQLGNGTYTNSSTPATVNGITTAIAIAAGGWHTCALLSNGTVQCWGYSGYGQLGSGTTADSSTPVTVSGITTAIAISAGRYHTCALLSNGTVQCWGRNDDGELGNGTVTTVSPYGITTPVAVSGISTATVITTGGYHTCAVLSNGTAQCWGYNSNGQLGNGATTDSYSPATVTGITTATTITAGGWHTCARLSNGTVQCWGYNNDGQLGNGATTDSYIPATVSGITLTLSPDTTPPSTPQNLAATSASSTQIDLYWSVATDNTGVTGYRIERCLGSGCTAFSQIAAITTTEYIDSSLSPNTFYSYRVRAIDAAGNLSGYSNIVSLTTPLMGFTPSISAGRYHSCALLSNSTVQCWGLNADGELGNGTTTNSSTPVVVSGINSATMIAAGGWHNCALLSNGTVQCWGNNLYSQLGNGLTTNSSTPVAVSGISNASAVAGGAYDTCVLLSNGTVQCWGLNTDGQLGNGTYTNSSTPVTVTGITTATQIATGGWHNCALLSNGTVQCWGYGNYGQLGNGTAGDSSTPVTVSGITTAIAISAGRYHTCALLLNGTVQCWGRNDDGELGNGTVTSVSPYGIRTPVTVSGISTATVITTGGYHTCAVLSSGTVQCWGYNSNGQLGNNTLTSSSTPVAVSGITTATTITAGGWHTCARLSNGTVQCWGYNNDGQLGNNTTTDSSIPVTVNGITTADIGNTFRYAKATLTWNNGALSLTL